MGGKIIQVLVADVAEFLLNTIFVTIRSLSTIYSLVDTNKILEHLVQNNVLDVCEVFDIVFNDLVPNLPHVALFVEPFFLISIEGQLFQASVRLYTRILLSTMYILLHC